MPCENQKTNTPSPLESSAAVSVVVPARKGKFLRLEGTADSEDIHERKLQNQRRYKAKLKSGITGKIASFMFRNPEYRRLDAQIDWAKVFAERRDDALAPCPLSKHFYTWAARGDASVLKFLSVLLSLNVEAVATIKHEHVSRLLFGKKTKPISKEKRKEMNARYKEYRKEYYKKRRADPEYVAEQRKRGAEDFQKSKQRIYAYRKQRRKDDPQYQIACNLRTYIYQRVGKKNTTGQSRFREIVGCSIAEFCKWLESHWEPWMNWGNYGKGKGKWAIDHTRCCASFDLTDPEQVKQCFHFSNQKPMEWMENLIKSDSLTSEQEAEILRSTLSKGGKIPATI